MSPGAADVAANSDASWSDGLAGSDAGFLRACAIVAGMTSAVLFIVVGLGFVLQEYADGAMFSYAIAVQDAWAFHWHNISGRLFVYFVIEVPAEIYIALTQDVRGGIVFYGSLYFAAQLLGLIATWAADRSTGRVIFTFACASTACLCPLVFGFPTEMWVAHAVFWPTLAASHYARGVAGFFLVLAATLALAFSHEAGLVLAAVIVFTVLLRGPKDAGLLRSAGVFLIAIAAWTIVKLTLPPDAYDGPVMRQAALHFFDPEVLTSYLLVVLYVALIAYGVALYGLWRLHAPRPHFVAALLVAAALAAYWLWFDRSIHAEQRYHMRTILLLGSAALGLLAATVALGSEDQINLPVPLSQRLIGAIRAGTTVRAVTGAILVVMLVHAVETAKFAGAWTAYRAAVRDLALGTASDPALGNSQFVSAASIGAALNRLSWFSTTPYLSVLLAPGFAPSRLVVDPTASYFWLSCETAVANEKAERAIAPEGRRLVRLYACLHR